MARWVPDNQINQSEHVGRRLFDEPMLFGAYDQPSYNGLGLWNFQESRGRDFSIDRMGMTSCDRRVVKYLEPRAENHATKFNKPKEFCGWAFIRASKLFRPDTGPPLRLIPSPVPEGNSEWSDMDLEQNRYHAHIQIPEDVESEAFALRIRHLLTKPGGGGAIQQSEYAKRKAAGNGASDANRPEAGKWRSMCSAILRLLRKGL